MTDVLDDDVLADVAGDNDDDTPSSGTGNTFVCDYVGAEGVCGESFGSAMGLGSHKRRKHGVEGTSASARQQRAKKEGNKPPARSKAKSAPKQAATRAAGPVTDRAAIYTSSLSMAALAAYFALPPFNNADLDICNAGAPNIGRALANLADHNPSVARACDLILGGGGGGDWIAVIMAVVPVAGAIAANHGLVPASTGARLGESIGFVPTSPPRPPAAAASPAGDGVGAPEPTVNGQRTVEDVIAYLEGTPPTVLADMAGRMMSMGGPIPVGVPFSMTPTENPDGHSGSEQLRPIDPNDEAAEQESGASVPA